MFVPNQNFFSKALPPAVFVLLLALRLVRTKENELTKFSNGFNASPALDPFESSFAASADNKAVDNVRSVLGRDSRLAL